MNALDRQELAYKWLLKVASPEMECDRCLWYDLFDWSGERGQMMANGADHDLDPDEVHRMHGTAMAWVLAAIGTLLFRWWAAPIRVPLYALSLFRLWLLADRPAPWCENHAAPLVDGLPRLPPPELPSDPEPLVGQVEGIDAQEELWEAWSALTDALGTEHPVIPDLAAGIKQLAAQRDEARERVGGSP